MTGKPLPHKAEVVIVGGGVVGLALAGFLAEGGREVALFDAGGPAGSTANAGSLHVQMQSRFLRMYPEQVPALESGLHLYPKAVDFWHDLERKLGADFGMKMTGGLMVAETDDQLDFLRKKAARERALGLDSEILERNDLNRVAPYIGPAIVGAELCANEGKLNPLQANAAIRSWALARGAAIFDSVAVSALVPDGSEIAVETASGKLGARQVVIAAAYGSRSLLEPFGYKLAIEAEPLHVNITERAAPFIGHLVQHAERPITLKQFASGHVVIGGGWPANLGHGRGFPTVELASIIGNATLAQHIVPTVSNLHIIRTWAGVNTPTDGKSILGPVEGVPGLFVAIPGDAGYTLGPLCASLVADCVLGRTPAEDLVPYSPARFRKDNAARPSAL
ncbi:MAG: FAD-binding oxidoreductase [Rhizobiaceae bacterium]|nr:FAD-binding oxidoreductase [Rhizobiaceae bacterium]